jgi:CRISPR-associated endonuclease Csn1
MAKEKYRLGLDLGTNSIGWCAYRLDENDEPASILRMGVRIFSDGRNAKSLQSLAADRRLARQMRRRRDRWLKRMRRMRDGLLAAGLWPTEEGERQALKGLDPYELRRRALDAPLTPHEIGRAIYHLARRRGFRSSRKERRDADQQKDAGLITKAVQRLREQCQAAGARTVGEYLAMLHAERKTVRARRTADGEYVLYLQRAMVSEEFDILWESQHRHHPELLTASARETLRDTLLFQRPLKPVKPGRCPFERHEDREPLASPLQQQFRILQELNNLRLIDGPNARPLTLEERDRCLGALLTNGKQTFAELRRLIGAPRSTKFNLELDGRRRDLKGDAVESQLAPVLGERWTALSAAERRDLALVVEKTDDTTALIDVLCKPPWSLDPTTAERLARVTLPEGYGSLGPTALARIVAELKRDVVTYDVAVERAGYGSHSSQYTGELHPRLPYYGALLSGYVTPVETARVAEEREFGRIANPTVHIGLNQLRLIVNELIRRFGHPAQIIVELAREFGMSGKRRREIEREQQENADYNATLDSELVQLGQRVNRENRIRLRLFHELTRKDPLGACCIYSGEPISLALLFSDEVEIDHILPFSRSLNDGLGNRLLCRRRANRDKGNRTPFEAFSHNPSGYSWPAILARAEQLLDARKLKWFSETALEDFLGGRDFLDRQLIDTQYLSRVAREYLTAVCPPHAVWVSSGRLTGLLRSKLGLHDILSSDGRKNRDDHRHHAVDAAVVGVCSRSLIKRVADAAARAEAAGLDRLLDGLQPPWTSFRADVAAAVSKIVVSHRPDHGLEGPLHNDTNYSLRAEPAAGERAPLVAHRVPLESLKPADLDAVAGPQLREALRAALAGKSAAGDVRAALRAFGERTGTRRVLIEERLKVVPIRDRRSGQPYRYVKTDGNYCYDIVPDRRGRWTGSVVSRFAANQQAGSDASHGPLVRLVPGDMIAITENGRRRILCVRQITDGTVKCAEHFEANVDARARSRESGFKYLMAAPSRLQQLEARPVGVDVLGYVNDRGFRRDWSDRGDRQ